LSLISSTAVSPQSSSAPAPQITVLDTGGQYTHLIARKVRELGVFADVLPSETPAELLRNRKGVIISGGPCSVYEAGSPGIDPSLLHNGLPVLGICYGHQLIAHHLGGAVEKGERGEYGVAHLELTADDSLWKNVGPSQQIWMSHRDSVMRPPPGFAVIASTETSGVAAMSDSKRKIYGLQFHPEVVHTPAGKDILSNFLFDICEAKRDWDVSRRVPLLEEQIRQTAGDRNVFFFVSGGVDSTVAYALCLRALGPERVYGMYVDTGLMRLGETEFVQTIFKRLGAAHFHVEHADTEFLTELAGLHEPEQKRRAIGEQFVKVQERILQTGHFLDGHWILGQGTIYPDTIESGGTAKADLIKTHHNRVAGIQALIESNRIIEPLTSFYKDEVREIGREIGVPQEFLGRHPFPGPGLAIRCLCSPHDAPLVKSADGWILPVRSVGVQGDSRSYRHVLALEAPPTKGMIRREAPALTNRRRDINRVVALAGMQSPLRSMRLFEAYLTRERLDLLREADAVVRRFASDTGIEQSVWQFPVVLLPIGTTSARESVVLRPIDSIDGMTAEAVLIEPAQLERLTNELLRIPGISAVFYDVTNKPPGTIEWE
jgi:GMP synthase (glutamine-hydrolyzing), N-terminal domain or A subunit